MNFRQHAIDIRQHIVIPETQDAIAIGFETSCAFPIGRNILCMLPAIHFNDQL